MEYNQARGLTSQAMAGQSDSKQRVEMATKPPQDLDLGEQ